MKDDDILQEIRATRDAFAALHNHEVRAMLADLHAREVPGEWQVVSLPPRRIANGTLPSLRTNSMMADSTVEGLISKTI